MGPPMGMGVASSGPTEVGVMTVAETQVPYAVTLPGRAVATEQTDIRPRVSGMISEIAYVPGQAVAVGDLLFRIDAASYEAALASAEATLSSAQAALAAAQRTVDRYDQLGDVVTSSDRDTATTALMQATATVKSAEAALQTAQLNLDWTEVRSPIAGVVDLPQVSVGALVTANQTDALTTVTQSDPIYVDVAESAARIARVRDQIDSGSLTPDAGLTATLALESGTAYDKIGQLVSPGLSVSTSTGAVDFRFEFDNSDHRIMPGQFLRVDIVIAHQTAFLVPQRAGTRQSDGSLTVFIAENGIAKQVTLTTKGSYQNAWIVTSGLGDGDQVILDGLTSLRDGAEVTTVPVTIDAAGVVQDVTPAAGN